jgi:cholesterol transport system auxiliary component
MRRQAAPAPAPASGFLRPSLRIAAASLLAISLSGCISLLPKAKPSQLYRFGVPVTAAPLPPRPDAIGVFRAGGAFQTEAAGDRILTVTGERIAYLAETRWAAPAAVLFDEAVAQAFDAAPGRVRLVARGEPSRADLALRLDVRNFETRYGEGQDPVVVIRIRAVLTRPQGQAAVAEQMFEARIPAGRNRVSAIVAAYNQGLDKVLGEIAAWTNSSAA